MFSSADAPTREDFEYAAVGMLTILSLVDGRYYGSAKKWLPIPEGRLGAAEAGGDVTPPFHAPASHFEEAPTPA